VVPALGYRARGDLEARLSKQQKGGGAAKTTAQAARDKGLVTMARNEDRINDQVLAAVRAGRRREPVR